MYKQMDLTEYLYGISMSDADLNIMKSVLPAAVNANRAFDVRSYNAHTTGLPVPVEKNRLYLTLPAKIQSFLFFTRSILHF